jgi:threonine/homoserine/homoserine lactone efflux protein
LGILAANIVFFTLSGTGLGALLAASERIFAVVKWVGAGYLLYLGASALLQGPALPGSGDAKNTPSPGARSLFLRGFLLQLANPKALLFFVAILPQFLDRGQPVLLQIVILVTTSVVMEFAVFAAYGAAAGRVAGVARQPRFALATTRLSGVLLVGAALGLARLER